MESGVKLIIDLEMRQFKQKAHRELRGLSCEGCNGCGLASPSNQR